MKNPQIIEKRVLVVIVSIAASECFALFFCLSRKIIKKMRSQRTRNASCIGDGRASDSTKRSARAGWGEIEATLYSETETRGPAPSTQWNGEKSDFDATPSLVHSFIHARASAHQGLIQSFSSGLRSYDYVFGGHFFICGGWTLKRAAVT